MPLLGSRGEASRIVEDNPGLLGREIPRSFKGEDIWYLVFSWDFGSRGDEAEAITATDPLLARKEKVQWHFANAGTFDEVISFVKEQEARAKPHGRAVVGSISLINLSSIVRRVAARAEQNGIDPALLAKFGLKKSED